MRKSFTILLLALTCSTKLFSQNTKPCPQYPEILDDFSIFKPNYHQYQVDYEICDLEQYPQCTPELVFKTMLSSIAYIAPTTDNNSVKNCEKVEVKGFGTIVTVINQKSLSVTNYTTPKHWLHAGKVTRQIVKQGNKILVFTFGNGNNRNAVYAWINERQTSADYLWHSVDEKLKVAVEAALKQIPKENPDNSQNPISISEEKKSLKEAAIAFYKWDENVWETSATAMKLQTFKLVLNKQGKPEEEDGYGCPCTINWKEAENFFAWVRNRSPYISNDYFLYSKEAMKKAEEKMKKAKTSQENLEAVEAFYIDGMFHIFPGNAGPPKFSQSGIYGNSAIWEIELNADGTADINTTFKMPSGWADKVGAYKLRMVKEGGAWKLAAPVEEGKISRLFGK